ncbi:MAG: methyl-accepting chemotaxis protein [Myxococcaceae bacterium]|nr:methyl-accepting chemotaxis protein [Myxococcaceae bacterium]
MTSTAIITTCVHETLGGIQQDLERAEGLVRDGMLTLGQTFGAFRTELVVQQRELGAVVELLQGGGSSLGFVDRMTVIVERFMDDILHVSAASMRLMGRIDEMGPDIEAIVTTTRKVSTMARRTRFVALNATIHSARSGFEGRTFRVVADQIKELANDAALVSEEIQGIVAAANGRLADVRVAMVGLASHDVNGAVEGQSRVIELLRTLDETNRRVRSALAEVEASAVQTVKAFELEDQLRTLFGTTRRQLEALASVWDAWAAGQGEPPAEVAALFESLEGTLRKASAVQQTSMDAGTVELF